MTTIRRSGREIRVERRAIPERRATVSSLGVVFARAAPDRTGPTAVDCEHLLRGRSNFPREFYEGAI